MFSATARRPRTKRGAKSKRQMLLGLRLPCQERSTITGGSGEVALDRRREPRAGGDVGGGGDGQAPRAGGGGGGRAHDDRGKVRAGPPEGGKSLDRRGRCEGHGIE